VVRRVQGLPCGMIPFIIIRHAKIMMKKPAFALFLKTGLKNAITAEA
jgi:hypothetical protein